MSKMPLDPYAHNCASLCVGLAFPDIVLITFGSVALCSH